MDTSRDRWTFTNLYSLPKVPLWNFHEAPLRSLNPLMQHTEENLRHGLGKEHPIPRRQNHQLCPSSFVTCVYFHLSRICAYHWTCVESSTSSRIVYVTLDLQLARLRRQSTIWQRHASPLPIQQGDVLLLHLVLEVSKLIRGRSPNQNFITIW